MKIYHKDLLSTLENDTKEMIRILQNELYPLDLELLNQKPAPEKWSILECIEHLNLTGDIYLSRFKEALIQAPIENKDYFTAGFIGNYMTKSMKPTEKGLIKSKMKTFKSLDPEKNSSNLDKKVLDIFLVQLAEFLQYVENAKGKYLGKASVVSAIGPIIKFKLGDGLRFVLAHNQRHILQAQNVFKSIRAK